jgi:hypothetical protein
MTRAALFIALVAGLCGGVMAQQQKPPTHIFGLYSKRVPVCFNAPVGSVEKFECEGETANWILVVPAAGKGVLVQINLLFHNGHTCEFSGNGIWAADHVLVEKHDAEACKMKVYFKGGRARLSADDQCRLTTCGARGGYGGIELPKRGSM